MKPCVSAIWLSVALLGQSAAEVLFFNGTGNYPNGSGGFLDCAACRENSGNFVYDDFVVPEQGWYLSGLFGQYLTAPDALPSFAFWEIRQAIGQGDSGQLIAAGTGQIQATMLPLPPGGLEGYLGWYWQYTVHIPGSIHLSSGPYWMTLAPFVLSAYGETSLLFTDATDGIHSVINGESFVRGPYWEDMQHIGDYLIEFTGNSNYDFAYGLLGTAVPEPGTLSLLMMSFLLIVASRIRRRSRTSVGATKVLRRARRTRCWGSVGAKNRVGGP